MPPATKPGNACLPMFPQEMEKRGWDELDILLITGDAYVDHPSFGVALLGRWLEQHGFRVGVIAQPRWQDAEDIKRLGRPRLFAGITAGALDSMLAHYTAFRKKRSDDAYTPGGKSGARPNRATLVYTSLVRQAFPGLPVLIGGIEASLRRASHFDFWGNALRKSILLDSKADLLIAGMAEECLLNIARALQANQDPRGIPGTVFALKKGEEISDFTDQSPIVELPTHEAILGDPPQLMHATQALEKQVHQKNHWLVQESNGRRVLFAPLPAPLNAAKLDQLYKLPYTRMPHPSYKQAIPAADMIRFSITAHRGCGGGCAFCSLALHQGRTIQSRSAASIEEEARELTRHPKWRGSISDIGGPTANMWGAQCSLAKGDCQRSSCLAPQICPHFKVDQKKYLRLLQRIQGLPGMKHLRVASGLRYDLALTDTEFTCGFLKDFVGGQLKVAPEHTVDNVLLRMRKTPFSFFEKFLRLFEQQAHKNRQEQYLIPYLMSALPGCTDADMRQLQGWFQERGWRPQQVQCFIPTPGTIATAMYYAGVDEKGAPISVARSDAERLRQHRLLIDNAKARPNKHISHQNKEKHPIRIKDNQRKNNTKRRKKLRR